jgi:hypothetical protein
MRVGNRPHNSTLLYEREQRVADRRCSRSSQNVITLATRKASPRTPSGKQATLLASRRERHYELRII